SKSQPYTLLLGQCTKSHNQLAIPYQPLVYHLSSIVVHNCRYTRPFGLVSFWVMSLHLTHIRPTKPGRRLLLYRSCAEYVVPRSFNMAIITQPVSNGCFIQHSSRSRHTVPPPRLHAGYLGQLGLAQYP
ncbi:hypothetical protein, partial [Porticoccus sp.]